MWSIVENKEGEGERELGKTGILENSQGSYGSVKSRKMNDLKES